MYKFLTIMLAAEGQGQSSLGFWIMMILIFVVMWLFMIRPQRKKQQELEKKRKEMQPGDKVITAGGIHGKIEKIQDETMTIEIAKGVSIKIDKSSVFVDQTQDKPTTKTEKKEGEAATETAAVASKELTEEEKAALAKEEKNAKFKKYTMYGLLIVVVLVFALWLGGVFGNSNKSENNTKDTIATSQTEEATAKSPKTADESSKVVDESQKTAESK